MSLPVTYNTAPTPHAKSFACELHVAPGLADGEIYIAARAYGFTSGDGYLSEVDGLDLLAQLAEHYGYKLVHAYEISDEMPEAEYLGLIADADLHGKAAKLPQELQPYEPQVADLAKVTVDAPWCAPFSVGDLVDVRRVHDARNVEVAAVDDVSDDPTLYYLDAADHLELVQRIPDCECC